MPPPGLLRPTDTLRYDSDVEEGDVQVQERSARGTYIVGQHTFSLLPRVPFSAVPASPEVVYSLADLPVVAGATLVRTFRDDDSVLREETSYGWMARNARGGALEPSLPDDAPIVVRGESQRGVALLLETGDDGLLSTSARFGR